MGRPLKIIKTNSAADPDGKVDAGYPNDGTTNNGFSRSYPGILGGSIPTFNDSDQVEASVAIEKKQYGTIVTSTAHTCVSGFGTSFSNVLSVGSSIYADGITAAIGTVNTLNADASDTATATTASNDRITVTASAQFVVGGAVTVAANIGNLVAGTVYYVYDLPTSTTLRVSSTPDLATVFQLADTTSQTVAITQTQTLTLNAVSTASVTLSVWTSSTPASNNGYIVRQKGKRKFLVIAKTLIQDEFIAQGGSYMIVSVSNTDWAALGAGSDAAAGKIFTAIKDGTGLTTNGTVYAVGVCVLSNVADGSLTRNQMNLNLNKASGPDVFASSVSDHFAIDFTDNGTDENAGTKYIATLAGASDTPDPATGLIYVAVDNYD